MFEMFFQIANLSINPFTIFSIGLFGGFCSGFLGIGCGIIIMPALVYFGIPPLIAVATQLCHAVGTNFINFLSYKRKRDVDFNLAYYILIGGFFGAYCEWILMKFYKNQDAIVNKFIYIYVVVLFVFGIVMLTQGIKEWKLRSHKKKSNTSVIMRRWMLYLPFHKIFIRSRAEMSIIIPIFVGFLAGLLVSSLGGGNNLFMAPIITYLIGRISAVVHGTTALAGCIITAVVAAIYAERGYCCDMPFVLILFLGASCGSSIGVFLTYIIRRYYINIMAAMIIFGMSLSQLFVLFSDSLEKISACEQNSQESFIFQLASCNKIMYTLCCITLICFIAFVFEKALRNLSCWYKNYTAKKRKEK